MVPFTEEAAENLVIFGKRWMFSYSMRAWLLHSTMKIVESKGFPPYSGVGYFGKGKLFKAELGFQLHILFSTSC